MQDVIDARINRAKNLLLHSGMNVSEAACCCGFCSVSHFSKLFRKSAGMSPSRYVKMKKGAAGEGQSQAVTADEAPMRARMPGLYRSSRVR